MPVVFVVAAIVIVVAVAVIVVVVVDVVLVVVVVVLCYCLQELNNPRRSTLFIQLSTSFFSATKALNS